MIVLDDVDCTKENCGEKVVAGLKGAKVDLVLYVSGVVIPEVSTRFTSLKAIFTGFG